MFGTDGESKQELLTALKYPNDTTDQDIAKYFAEMHNDHRNIDKLKIGECLLKFFNLHIKYFTFPLNSQQDLLEGRFYSKGIFQ
jgi:hypothetical protein